MGALVSIIMPSFNSANTICEAIDSVIMQTYNNWELLITDDCSTDTTVSLVKSYCENDDRIKLFQNKINSGAAVSRNYSLENARGEYIAFLDSDDIWFSNKLEVQLEFMKLNRGLILLLLHTNSLMHLVLAKINSLIYKVKMYQ